jgi:hypothetical protein
VKSFLFILVQDGYQMHTLLFLEYVHDLFMCPEMQLFHVLTSVPYCDKKERERKESISQHLSRPSIIQVVHNLTNILINTFLRS